jgi:hypothetical protein
LFQEGEDNLPSGSGRNSPAVSSSSSRKTEAEKRFEEAQKRRVRFYHFLFAKYLFFALKLAERVAKLANKTHKDRVNEFNAHLESLSEHHDIPKVTGFVVIVKFGTDFEHHLGGTRIIRYLIYSCWAAINISEGMLSMCLFLT